MGPLGSARRMGVIAVAVSALIAVTAVAGYAFKEGKGDEGDELRLLNVRGKLSRQPTDDDTRGAYLLTTRQGHRYAVTDKGSGLLIPYAGERVMLAREATPDDVRAAGDQGEPPLLVTDEVRPLGQGDGKNDGQDDGQDDGSAEDQPLPAPPFASADGSKGLHFAVRVPRCLQGETVLYAMFDTAESDDRVETAGAGHSDSPLAPETAAVRLWGGQSDETPYPGFVYRKSTAFEPGTRLRVWIARGTSEQGPQQIIYPRGEQVSEGRLVTVDDPMPTTVSTTYNPHDVRPREDPMKTRECRRS